MWATESGTDADFNPDGRRAAGGNLGNLRNPPLARIFALASNRRSYRTTGEAMAAIVEEVRGMLREGEKKGGS